MLLLCFQRAMRIMSTQNVMQVSSASPPSQTGNLRRSVERLRILHVVASLGIGGTEHGLLKVIDGLGEEQFEHRICAVRGVDENFAERMNLTGKVCSVGTGRPGFQFPLFRLLRIMHAFKPHIVHSRNFGALEAIPAAVLARVPVAIHSEHGYELEILDGLPLRRRVLCHGFFKMADAVFVVTEELRRYHSRQSWLPSERFRVLANGVNTDHFAPSQEYRKKVRAEMGIPQERLVIGSVGRLVPIKDYGTLLQAAAELVRQGRDIHVLLVGAGPERDGLGRQVTASPLLEGRVTFAGVSNRVLEMMNALDIFVLTSVCEGMSNTLLEAMASGLPVVATRTGGSPEIIAEGCCGYLFSPRDVAALTQLLARLAEDAGLRRTMGSAGRSRVSDHFALPIMVQRYRDLYCELASKRDTRKGN